MIRQGAIPVLVALACGLAACQSTPPTGAPATIEPSAPGGTGGTVAPTAAGNVITGPGDMFVLEPTDGLDALDSYTAKLVVTFDGTESGTASSWTSTTTYSFVRAPSAYLLTVDQPASLPAPLPAWSAAADGAAFTRNDEGACFTSLPELPETPGLGEDPNAPAARAFALDPVAQLPGFVGAESTGTETVLGVASEVGTFDARALGWSGPTTAASGRVAVAVNGGYIVQFDLAADGGAELFGEGSSGKLTQHYELTGIGTTTVAIPTSCPAGIIEGHLTTDAADIESLPGYLTFTTKDAVAKTGAFYRDTSLAFGWKSAGDTLISPDLATLHFTADGLEITVGITAITGGSRVEIIATRT